MLHTLIIEHFFLRWYDGNIKAAHMQLSDKWFTHRVAFKTWRREKTMKKILAIIMICLMLTCGPVASYAASVPAAEPAAKKYTITKVVGSKVYKQKVKGGNKKGKITYVEKKGKVFAGWYKDKACKKHADFTKVKSNMKVYAKYVKIKSVKMEQTGKSGSTIKVKVIVKVPAKRFQAIVANYSWPVDASSGDASALKTSYDTFTMNTAFAKLKSGRKVTMKCKLTTWDGTKVKCPTYVFLYKNKKFTR